MSVAIADTRPIARWLYGVLHGDATILAEAPGGVWEDYVDQSVTTFPAVVYSFVSGQDVRPNGAGPIAVDAVYTVKAIGQTASYADIEALMNRVYALVDNGAGSVTGGQVFIAQRIQHVQYSEVTDGKPFRHLGARFRILAV